MEHYLSGYCDSTSLTIYLWLHFFKPNIAAPIEQQTIWIQQLYLTRLLVEGSKLFFYVSNL